MHDVSIFLDFIDTFLRYVDGNDIPTSVIPAEAGIYFDFKCINMDSRFRGNDEPKSYSSPAKACCKSDFFSSSRQAILRW
jgi:hypothetical protein